MEEKDQQKMQIAEKQKDRELTKDEQLFLEMPHPELEEILQLE